MQRDDLVSLMGRLLWGTATTRQQLAEQLAQSGSKAGRVMLAETVRSAEPWRLRARCLEVLGLAAGQAQREVAEEILGHLLRLPQPEAPQPELDGRQGEPLGSGG